MPIIIAACIYLYFVLEGDGECSKKRKRISFSFVSPSLSLIHLTPPLKRQRNLFFYLFRVLDPTRELFNQTCSVFSVVAKMKGISKGVNNFFSQMFVVKEREMEIGLPTDVKHVAHIGWDGSSSTSSPSWMNEFKTGPEFATSSIGNNGSALSPWSSQDYGEESMGQSTSDLCRDTPSDLPNIPKAKQKRRKIRSTTSPRSSSSSTSKTPREAKSKAKLVEGNAEPAGIEVAIGVQNSENIELA